MNKIFLQILAIFAFFEANIAASSFGAHNNIVAIPAGSYIKNVNTTNTIWIGAAGNISATAVGPYGRFYPKPQTQYFIYPSQPQKDTEIDTTAIYYSDLVNYTYKDAYVKNGMLSGPQTMLVTAGSGDFIVS